jgi:DNA invertase Pin-like site-specific DNA recombinase
MRCSIYARRSTDEHQAASIEVQLEEARRYIDRKGWTVSEEHIYVDSAVSRAEFKKRPGLISLMVAAEKGEFDTVILRDETRLGGDLIRTSLVVQDLVDAGVHLRYYYTDEEVVLDGAMPKFMMSARLFQAELEREKISQRTHEHLMTKARRGLNVGGRVYGYDNVEIKEGERRLRVEYRVNAEQAAIIVRIFREYAEGKGLRAIAKALNAKGVLAPRAGRPWSPVCIWEMLRRERYRGAIIWGQREKTYRKGTKVRIARPECEWIRIDAPHLRIVDDAHWNAVVRRMEQTKRFTGRTGPRGPAPKYLLSGLARCASCGGPMQAVNGKVSHDNVKVYVCYRHRTRGDAVCSNTLRRPVATVDAALIDWIQANVLTESLVLSTLREVRRRLAERSKKIGYELPELRAEARKVKAEIEKLGLALLASDERPKHVIKMMDRPRAPPYGHRGTHRVNGARAGRDRPRDAPDGEGSPGSPGRSARPSEPQPGTGPQGSGVAARWPADVHADRNSGGKALRSFGENRRRWFVHY